MFWTMVRLGLIRLVYSEKEYLRWKEKLLLLEAWKANKSMKRLRW